MDYWITSSTHTLSSDLKGSGTDRLGLIDWRLMALSAQTGCIVPLISMLQLKK